MTRTVRTFGEVVDAHQVEVMRYLRRLTSNGAEAEDLFQETFLRALPAFGRLRTGSSHRVWLYRIATNVFLNERRSCSGSYSAVPTLRLPARWEGVRPELAPTCIRRSAD